MLMKMRDPFRLGSWKTQRCNIFHVVNTQGWGNMKKKYFIPAAIASISLVASSLLASTSANAAATGTLAEVLARGKIIVGTGSGNAPWHFKDASGNLVGMDIDIARMLAKGLFDDESKVEFVQQTSDSRIPNILTGKIDITCQFMTINAARAQQVAFTTPYYREGIGLLLSKKGKYKSFAELKAAGSKARISILQNVGAEEGVHEALPKAKVLQFSDVPLIYSAIDSGRADAAATDQSSVGWMVAQFPKKYADGGAGWHPMNYGCALKQGDQVWLNFINQVLNEAISGDAYPAYAASFKKWFGVTLPSPHIGYPRP